MTKVVDGALVGQREPMMWLVTLDDATSVVDEELSSES